MDGMMRAVLALVRAPAGGAWVAAYYDPDADVQERLGAWVFSDLARALRGLDELFGEELLVWDWEYVVCEAAGAPQATHAFANKPGTEMLLTLEWTDVDDTTGPSDYGARRMSGTRRVYAGGGG